MIVNGPSAGIGTLKGEALSSTGFGSGTAEDEVTVAVGSGSADAFDSTLIEAFSSDSLGFPKAEVEPKAVDEPNADVDPKADVEPKAEVLGCSGLSFLVSVAVEALFGDPKAPPGPKALELPKAELDDVLADPNVPEPKAEGLGAAKADPGFDGVGAENVPKAGDPKADVVGFPNPAEPKAGLSFFWTFLLDEDGEVGAAPKDEVAPKAGVDPKAGEVPKAGVDLAAPKVDPGLLKPPSVGSLLGAAPNPKEALAGPDVELFPKALAPSLLFCKAASSALGVAVPATAVSSELLSKMLAGLTIAGYSGVLLFKIL